MEVSGLFSQHNEIELKLNKLNSESYEIKKQIQELSKSGENINKSIIDLRDEAKNYDFDVKTIEEFNSKSIQNVITSTHENINRLENAQAVIATKRAQVHWKYIVFEHNKHQVEDARQLAKDAGFTTFSTVKTSRDVFAPKSGSFVHTKKTKEYQKAERKIHCVW